VFSVPSSRVFQLSNLSRLTHWLKDLSDTSIAWRPDVDQIAVNQRRHAVHVLDQITWQSAPSTATV
jgi:hypothetical protein